MWLSHPDTYGHFDPYTHSYTHLLPYTHGNFDIYTHPYAHLLSYTHARA
ncbi:MAG: hypothetical protein ABIG98_02535 [Chloroflexota bacterium]